MVFPTAFTGGGALSFALSAVDKVAGKTREQLESGVGSFAQCESFDLLLNWVDDTVLMLGCDLVV